MSATASEQGTRAEATSASAPSLVRELSAITIESTDLDTWERFASTVMGTPIERSEGELRLRMDGYPYRFRIKSGTRDGITAVAWQARDAAALAEIKRRWESWGGAAATVAAGDRFGQSADAFFFTDPQGIVHEVFETLPPETPFEPTAEVSGFVTGIAGLGHIVFFDDVDKYDRIFTDLFEMALRIDAKKTQVGGRGRFYGCNARDHTSAVVEVPGQSPTVMHVMIEMLDIDDVGQSRDRAVLNDFAPRTALGRHGDHVISFYIPSPGGFDFEIGTGGRLHIENDPTPPKRARTWGHAGIRPQSPAGN